jgi:F420-dependent oxidoreductase-like protein
MRTLIRSAIQIPFFGLPGVPPEQLFEHTARVAQCADDEGFDALFVMDHFFQLPFLGGAQQPMLEGYSLLSALAARTQRIRLGALVTGVTYRNPALLAKTITTLDVISGGRAIAGLGAAWYEEEHAAFGYEFPSTADRFTLLEDTIEIAAAMFRGTPDHVGSVASIAGAYNVPAPITPGGPPILIGGAGERRTLPLVARLAGASNFNCTIDEAPAKLEVLDGLLTAAGRTRDDVNVTLLCSIVCAEDDAAAEVKLRGLVAQRGMDPAALDDPAVRSMMTSRMMVGGIDRVAAQLASVCHPGGLDGVVAMLPADAADPEGPSVVAAAFRSAGLLD